MASPTKWQAFYEKAEGADAKAKSQAAWAAFAKEASGTGPWKMSKFTPRERLELVKNEAYWDKARVPKVDKMVLLPMPEANARTAALLSGQVDWVEAPAPDAVKEIKQRGFPVTSNEEPHVWPWQFSRDRRLAVERHPRPQGGQPLRRSRRPARTACSPA